ncbi:MAG: FAD-binding oxidoreductase [Alphaproteobacteria bacterium]|nr:FAD-binding oxidoreductase [Alphaproteobacteria bacterium]
MNPDIIIAGGGIGGAAAGYFLSRHFRVLLLEQESMAGYHASGRSASIFTANYGSDIVSALARSSRAFLDAPPPDFVSTPLLGPLGVVTVCGPGQEDLFADALRLARARVPDLQHAGAAFACTRLPFLRPERIADSFFEPGAADIDTDALHQGYLRGIAAAGGRVAFDARIVAVGRSGGAWRVRTAKGMQAEAPLFVNAAGPWADMVAGLAGLAPLGLEPRRRTAILVALPAAVEARALPMVTLADDTLYARPSGGALMASPADATPSPPCDAQPEEYDVAVAIDRLSQVTTLKPERVLRKWAGLRTFHPDGNPVLGEDAGAPGFFWLAGQGGAGIKTSPALGMLLASAVRREAPPPILAGIDGAALAPRR